MHRRLLQAVLDPIVGKREGIGSFLLDPAVTAMICALPVHFRYAVDYFAGMS
jgi:hypothetical protein